MVSSINSVPDIDQYASIWMYTAQKEKRAEVKILQRAVIPFHCRQQSVVEVRRIDFLETDDVRIQVPKFLHQQTMAVVLTQELSRCVAVFCSTPDAVALSQDVVTDHAKTVARSSTISRYGGVGNIGSVQNPW